MEAIERALETEVSCAEILNVGASVRGAASDLVIELLEDHLRNHVLDVESDALRASGAADLIEVMIRHLSGAIPLLSVRTFTCFWARTMAATSAHVGRGRAHGAEITAGTIFGLMTLLSDGWHMSTHASALLITALAYRYARRHAPEPAFHLRDGKRDLAAFGSATVLAMLRS